MALVDAFGDFGHAHGGAWGRSDVDIRHLATTVLEAEPFKLQCILWLKVIVLVV